ncbi:hypothetical protein [Yeosuana marina]|uniref:hypothetical protein n=1 Tax=Yeosuana marina TaxID=1565536 RepID=UPI0030EEEDED
MAGVGVSPEKIGGRFTQSFYLKLMKLGIYIYFTTRSLLRRGARTNRSIANAKQLYMKDLIFFEKLIALLSFIIGTTLFSLYLFFGKSNTIGTVGLYFVITAFVINSLLFLLI